VSLEAQQRLQQLLVVEKQQRLLVLAQESQK
jgi:hypothetical protein